MRLLWFERTATSPTWQRWRAGFEKANAWVERGLDLHEGAALAGAPLEAGGRGAGAGLALAVYALSGLTQVEADEVAVVRRFGRPLDDDLGRACTGAGRGRSRR